MTFPGISMPESGTFPTAPSHISPQPASLTDLSYLALKDR